MYNLIVYFSTLTPSSVDIAFPRSAKLHFDLNINLYCIESTKSEYDNNKIEQHNLLS